MPLAAHVLHEVASEVGLEAALGAGEDAPEVLPPLVPGEGAVAGKLLGGDSIMGSPLQGHPAT